MSGGKGLGVAVFSGVLFKDRGEIGDFLGKVVENQWVF